MGFQVVLVCAFLFMLQAENGNADCVRLQIRVPSSSINGDLQNQQLNPAIPFPYNRGGNICSSCRGRICNSNCQYNNPYRFKSPPGPFVVSVPSEKSTTGRLTITIDTSKPADSGATSPDTPADNGEINKQTVDVYVKLVPKEQVEKKETSTSGKSSAIKIKNGQVLRANTNGIILIPGSDKAINVSVFVRNVKTGKTVGQTILHSNIFANDGKGEVSETKTQANINKIRKPNSGRTLDGTATDGSDSNVTGGDSGTTPDTGTGSDTPAGDGTMPGDTGDTPADNGTPGDSGTPSGADTSGATGGDSTTGDGADTPSTSSGTVTTGSANDNGADTSSATTTAAG